MTLLEIKTAAASIHQKLVGDLTINGQDLGLVALNNARRAAEQQYDFEFSRRLVTVEVNGVTGGSLNTAKIYGTEAFIEVGTIIDVGLFDAKGNLWPVEWTTVAEGLERARRDNDLVRPRLSTEEWHEDLPIGRPRFVFTGTQVYAWPKDDTTTFTIGAEVYTNASEWETEDLATELPPWTTKGAQFLLWSVVHELNPLFKSFVNRTEGNIGEATPERKAEVALTKFREWDLMRFEQLRRHR